MTSTHRYRSILVVCALLATHGATAQQPTEVAEENVLAPFVSSLRTAVRDAQVRLVWRDSRYHAGGVYRVLRSRSDIVSTNLSDAEVIAEIPSGVETYLDTPSQPGRYFYAVVAIRRDGQPYTILIPFRNKTIQPVSIGQSPGKGPALSVYGLNARPVGRSVQLRFEVSRGDRGLSVYRSTLPFTLGSDFEDALLVGSIEDGARSWIDEPIPGVDYYYAVVDTAMVRLGSATPRVGQNTLAEPVRIALDRPVAPAPERGIRRLRPAPLPVLRVMTSVDDAGWLARNPVPASPSPLQPATREAVTELLARTPADGSGRPSRPEPVVLPQHRVVDGRGAFRTLTEIVTTEFTRGDWAPAAERLQDLLRTPLDDTLEREARFYLGQARYFSGQIQRAFMEFLLAGNGELYAESRIWIDAILDR